MFNKAILIGRVGNTPELSVSQTGTGICKFRVATSTGFGEKKRTDWHNIVCFGKLADNMSKYVQKGTVVNVEGSIQYSEYEKDGQKRVYTSILADTVNIITGGNFHKDQAPEGSYQAPAPVSDVPSYPQAASTDPQSPYYASAMDNDIPF